MAGPVPAIHVFTNETRPKCAKHYSMEPMNGNMLGIFPETATSKLRTQIELTCPNVEIYNSETISVDFHPGQLILCHCDRIGPTVRGEFVQKIAS